MSALSFPTSRYNRNFISALPEEIVARTWELSDPQTRYALIGSPQCNTPFDSIVQPFLARLMVYSGENACYECGTLAINEAKRESCRPTLAKYGAAFSVLELRFMQDESRKAILPMLREYCTNISQLFLRLDIWDSNIAELVDVLAPKLEIVEIVSFNKIITVMAAKKIAATCKKLDVLRFTGRGLVYLEEIWNSIGPGLTQIALRCRCEKARDWAAAVESLGINCRSLTSILLSGSALNGHQVGRLLLSYSDQLEEAMVSRLEPELCKPIALQCTNLQRCIIIEKDPQFRRIQALGPRLSELFLSISEESEIEQLAQASQKCNNIIKMVVECMDDVRYIHALFYNTKPLLHTVELDVDVFRKVDMDAMADATGNIRWLSIDATDVEESPDQLFHKLAESNKMIEKLSISIARDGCSFIDAMTDEMHIKFATGIADAFRNCRLLNSIEICNRRLSGSFPEGMSPQIEKAFSFFFVRKVRVLVFGTRFSSTS